MRLARAGLTGANLTDANLTDARFSEDVAVPEGWERDAEPRRLRRSDERQMGSTLRGYMERCPETCLWRSPGSRPVTAPDSCPEPRARLSVSGTCLPTVYAATTSVSQMTRVLVDRQTGQRALSHLTFGVRDMRRRHSASAITRDRDCLKMGSLDPSVR